MKYDLKLLEKAELDLEECFGYYEEIREGLGHDFLLCTEEALEKLQRNPLNYPVVYKDLRRLPLRRFPYRIFYKMHNQIIIVVAVFHARKNPSSWGSRI